MARFTKFEDIQAWQKARSLEPVSSIPAAALGRSARPARREERGVLEDEYASDEPRRGPTQIGPACWAPRGCGGRRSAPASLLLGVVLRLRRRRRFLDQAAWRSQRGSRGLMKPVLVRELYALSSDGVLSRDHALRDQVRRAAISMMSNIAEGFARRTSKEFANFLNMAHGSAAELQSHLYVATDLDYLSEKQVKVLYGKVEEVSKMVQGLIEYLGSTCNPQLVTQNWRRKS